MKLIQIGAVDEIYSCGKVVVVKWHSVKSPELRHFALSLDKFIWALGESTKDDFWVSSIRKLKRFRFDFCAAPLSEEILQSYRSELELFLREKIDTCSLMYPNASRQFNLLLSQLEALSKVKMSILLTSLGELPDLAHKDTVLLIREPRLVESVEDSFASNTRLKKIPVITPALLREEKCYKKLIVIGPSRWYPEYIFSAPRSPNILVVKYSWIKDHWKQEAVFSEPLKQRISKKREIVFDELEEDSTIAPEDLLPPSFDFQRIANRVNDDIRTDGEGDYVVDARVFLLEDGWAVFLEADETASVMVIDLESDHTEPVRRIKIGEVKAGMFILLRTGGGGDYIVPVADRIMGDNALIAREFQKEWKTHLRNKVRVTNYEHIIAQLKYFGSVRANQINIRNWMSDRTIKTDSIEDFRAIMRLIGLEKETEYYWDMMRLIDNAHRRAGMQIRKVLLALVTACNLDSLKRTGRMEFALPGEQSVSITAFQVKEISPIVVPVAPWRIGSPFESEE